MLSLRRATLLLAVAVGGTCHTAHGQASVQYAASVTTVTSNLALTNDYTNLLGIAVDGSGSIYVADAGNSRILKETPSGGGYTEGVILNTYASGIAVDESGNVYITGGGSVYKETLSAGNYIQSTIVSGLNNTQGIAVDTNGNLYISDSGNGRVVKESPNGNSYIQTVVANLPSTGLLGNPEGIAVDGSGNVYIADGNNGVLKETPSVGGYVQTVVGVSLAYGVAVDASGNVYVTGGFTGAVGEYVPSSGSYSLSSGGGPALELSALTPSAMGVAVDARGSVYLLDTYTLGKVLKDSISPANFGAINVGNAGADAYVFFGFITSNSNDVMTSSVIVSDASTPGGSEFTLDSSSSGYRCTDTNIILYTGTECFVPVKFTPQLSGVRTGTATLTVVGEPYTGIGTSSATVNITGTGAAPQVSFLPGNQTVVASAPSNGSLFDPEGVAVDGQGDLYIADTGSGRVLKESLSGGSYTQSVIPYTPTVNRPGPAGVAVDAGGNVYIADPSNGVYKETLSAGVYTQTQISPALAYGVAVDGSGNVYFAAGSNVYKDTFAGASYTLSTVGTDTFLDSVGVAVDYSGNVYVADSGTKKRVLKWTLTGSSYAENTVASGLGNPWGVAVDVSGNVYVGDQGGKLDKETFSGGTYSQSILGSNLVPYGVAVDGSGNVYVADAFDHRVYEIGYSSTPALSFASTAVGSTSSDSPQTVTIENSGTGALIFPTPSSGNNPSISANFSIGSLTTCPVVSSSSSPGTLSPGATCIYSVSFSPTTSGTVSGFLVLTDNSLNATNPYATQSISLSGTATGQVQVPIATLSATSLTFASQTDGTTSSAQTLTLTNSGAAALAITSIAISGDFAQTNNCSTGLAAGTKCTVLVTFTPTVAGTRTGTLTISDNTSGSPQTVALSGTGVSPVVTAPVVTLSPTGLTFASQTDGTTSAAQTVKLTNSGNAPLTIASIAASGDFALTHNCGTGVAAGANCTISVTFTPTAAGTRTGTVTITDNAGNSPQTVSLSGGGEAVSLSTTSTGITIPAVGGSGTATIQLSSLNGFTGTVNLTCAVTYLGQGTPTSPPSCSLSPAQAQVTGSSPVSSTLTIATTSASASLVHERELNGAKWALTAMFFFGLLQRRRHRNGLLLSLCLLALCPVVGVGVIGCSGSSGSSSTGTTTTGDGTTTGNYQVVVTATSGTVTASTTIPINVQ
jgi:sugar lactone lactonase YvrE